MEWINVKDRLPDRCQTVLCAWHPDAVGEHSPQITIRELIDKEGFRLAGVTHWQPLPEPPTI